MQQANTTMQSLHHWYSILHTCLNELEHDLSGRQMAVLLTVYLKPAPHSIKSLSQTLNISKAAICRAIDALSMLGLLKRRKDENDRRNVYIQRTVQGSVYLSDFADIIMKGGALHASTAELVKEVA